MKKVFTLILSSLILLNSVVFSTVEARSYRTKSSDVHIKSYTRKNGTKVKAYYRSKADNSKTNNYNCIDHGRCK